MAGNKRVTVDVKGLETLQKFLEKNKTSVRVGVFDERNALIGVVHEFGSKKRSIPKRSFLRMPLEKELPKKLRKLKLKSIEELKSSKLEQLFHTIGGMAIAAIGDAFATGGFGLWATLNEKYTQRKKVNDILVESTQLRDAIQYEIKEK